MKCKLTRPAQVANPNWRNEAEVIARAHGLAYTVPRYVDKPIGTEIRGPESWKLVRMGMAEPADDECRARCNMNQAQIDAAAKAQERGSKGIHPDDYEAFDRGEMVGYKPDGTFIPGPNFEQYQDDEFEDDDDE